MAIYENKIFALGLLLFFATKLLAHIPPLSKHAESPLVQFLSGLGTALVIVGLVAPPLIALKDKFLN